MNAVSEKELLDYDKPFIYDGHEIHRLEDLKMLISLEPDEALKKLADSKRDTREDHEKTEAIVRAEKAAREDFDRQLNSVRPKGEYYEQSMGDRKSVV